MTEVNWEWIILIVIVGLIFFAGMGIFVGTRISSDKRRIRELEDELAETRKDLEVYRSRVNSHFKKTSELFSEMTNTYRAIYMHLAQGSQDLCTTDAALLKPANEEFLKVAHEKNEGNTEQTHTGEAREKTEPPAETKAEKPESGDTLAAEEKDEPVKAEDQEGVQKPEEKEQEPLGKEQEVNKTESQVPPGTGDEKKEQSPGSTG